MKNDKYKPRIIDKQVKRHLATFGAICIEGPKWCGKTWTSISHCESSFFIGDPNNNFSNREMARLRPNSVLIGKSPRLIDEWQEVPPLWDSIRSEVDNRGLKGQFILTGSSTPQRKGILHSGIGRISTIRMRPMSLYETGQSTGVISLQDLCDNKLTPTVIDEVELIDLIDPIIRGGWPGNQDIPLENASLLPMSYIQLILQNEIHNIDEIKRDTDKVKILLQSLARNECTTVSKLSLMKDIKHEDRMNLSINTVSDYLNILDRLFLIDNQPPYSSKIRSSHRIKQAEKRHFVDPSLAAALLNLTPEMLMNDLPTFGLMFEALCERDLRIYAEANGGKLFHYQDYKNREIDAVIELKDGNYCAFEIKLGASKIDKAAKKLIALTQEIISNGGKPPKINCIICGIGNLAYQREDGVYVVPLTALKD